MPGKTPANRGGKESSISSGDLGTEKTKKYSIWPKWTDDELIIDKGGAGKPSETARMRKGTTASAGHIAGDKNCEEEILPSSLTGSDIEWVNPGVFIKAPNTPVIVAEPIPSEIDLISENTHLMHSELVCSIISQLQALWHLRSSPSLMTEGPNEVKKEWRPWDLIQHKKEHLVPMFNPLGRYGVKIFWMGSWRKIIVTDQLPVKQAPSTTADSEGVGGGGDEGEGEGRVVLLPRTSNTSELWPAILTKAILKVAALDFRGGEDWSEFGDCNVIHMLTGWCPQSLSTRVESDVLWEVLCRSLPLWKRTPNGELCEETSDGGGEGEVAEPPARPDGEDGESEGGGDSGDNGGGIITAQFTSACNGKPLTKSKEALMTDSLALLREHGIIPSQFDSQSDHARYMLVRQVRNISLLPPPKVNPPIPAPEEHAWLGYSLRRHAPWEGPPPKPHLPRWVEVVTPFPITTDLSNSQTLSNKAGEEEQQHPSEGEVETAVGDTGSKGSGTSVEGGDQEPQAVWMKYEDFRKAFSAVEVLTSPVNFKYNHTYKDLTATVESVNSQEETKGKGRTSHSPANKMAKCTETAMADDTNILFIEEREDCREDSGEEIELHFIFTCLSNWREGSKDLKTERKKSVALKQRRASILSNPLIQPRNFRYSVPARTLKTSTYTFGEGFSPCTIPELDEEDSTAGSTPTLLTPTTPPPPPPPASDERIMSGSVVVEEYDWKSIETKLPLLRLTTTGVKGAVMKIDRSKRIFKLHVKSPLGYHLSISSNVNFVLANEDSAYNKMHKENIGYSKVYSGPIAQLQPNSWTVVFREVLLVRRIDQFLAFSLDFPVTAGHQLRVVDNDDGREIPRVAHITEPQLYSPNKHGYTILCEMWTHSDPVTEGSNWRLRVISSDRELPLCEGQEREEEGEEEESEKGEGKEEDEDKVLEVMIAREFYHKEIQDYCLPDRDNVMFRYALKVSRDCPITVQLKTSKKDAYIQLEVFDGETLVAVTQGRAYCFIAMCQLVSQPPTISPENTVEDSTDAQLTNAHRYVLVATITHDSWPLADTAWSSIADIRAAEEDMAEKANAAKGGGGTKGKKPPSASSKGGKGKKSKGGKEGGGGGKESSDGVQSSPSLSNIDTSKPHWTLRVALRQLDRECFEMSKDTEKEDELKNMQTAWETEQPGRIKKGLESRQKFLDAHALKGYPNSTEDQPTTLPSSTSTDSSVQLSPSPSSLQPPHGPVPLQRIDLSLYTKYSDTTPHVLTAEEREMRDEEKRETIRQYRAWRQSILQSRDQDRQLRNEEKLRQLEEAEKQQSELEETRKRMNRGREKIRQRCLAEEKVRREAELAAIKSAEEETAASARDSKAKGKKGKKK